VDAHGPLEFFAVHAQEQGIRGDGYFLARANTEGPGGTGNPTALVEPAAYIDGTGKTGKAPTAEAPPLDHRQLSEIAILPSMTALP
jgi:hypothetical protein